MDTVTDARLAIAIAREGGPGRHPQEHVHRGAGRAGGQGSSARKTASSPILSSSPRINLVSDAQELMARYRISGVPITENGKLVGILTNRDLRFETDYSRKISEVMTSKKPRHRPRGHHAGAGRARILAKHRIEKTAAGGRELHAARPHHHQGHPEVPAVPQLRQGQARARLLCAAAVGVTRDMMDRVAALVNAKVDAVGLRHPPTATPPACSPPWRPSKRPIPTCRSSPATSPPRPRHPRPHHGRRGRGQGRHRPRLHLHHPRGRRHRRAADHRHHGLRRGGRPLRQDHHRRRRRQVLRRHPQGHRRRRQRRDARQPSSPARRRARARRRSIRAVPSRSIAAWVPSPPWPRAARTATSRRTPRSSCPRASRAACPTRGRWRTPSSSSWAACAPRWATAGRPPSSPCARERRVHPHHQRRPRREPPARHQHLQGSPQLLPRGIRLPPRTAAPPRAARRFCVPAKKNPEARLTCPRGCGMLYLDNAMMKPSSGKTPDQESLRLVEEGESAPRIPFGAARANRQ